MIRYTQIFGVLLIILGVVFVLDATRADTNIFGHHIKGYTINFAGGGSFQVLAGFVAIAIGLFMAIPKLIDLFDNK